MKTSTCRQGAIHFSVLCLLAAQAVAQTTTSVALAAITTLECYSGVGSLVKGSTQNFQTSGSCQVECGNANHPVMATTGGSTCYCGDELPARDLIVDKSLCNSPCNGFGTQSCGGIGYYQLYLDGLSGDVETAPNSTVSSSAKASSTAASSTKGPETVVITQPASSSPISEEAGNGGPNKVGIAVGVVVGVLVVAALVGGGIFLLKRKRKQEMLEEHKAQLAINSFVGSKNGDQNSDARLDPGMATSYRRESIGSIADERDFSRKILQVRNPDRGSMNSAA